MAITPRIDLSLRITPMKMEKEAEKCKKNWFCYNLGFNKFVLNFNVFDRSDLLLSFHTSWVESETSGSSPRQEPGPW